VALETDCSSLLCHERSPRCCVGVAVLPTSRSSPIERSERRGSAMAGMAVLSWGPIGASDHFQR
jgi:hypothetical protein